MSVLLLLAACAPDAPPAPPATPAAPAVAAPSPAAASPAGADVPALPGLLPTLEPLTGAPRPSLLLAQAAFVADAAGKPTTAPARLDIWRPDATGTWARTRLEDPASNVFHKALVDGSSVLTIGAEAALLKRWTPSAAGWTEETLWRGAWGGKFDRLRDAELGDVDGDGRRDLVVATHDQGVVAIVGLEVPDAPVTELGRRPDTFVHEIELGDLDGDGRPEVYAAVSGRNVEGRSQAGGIQSYRHAAGQWTERWVAAAQDTHAKEILAADLDGDGRDELYGVFAAVLGPDGTRTGPTRVVAYRAAPDGAIAGEVVAELDDKDARFLVAGDFDRDGRPELVAGAFAAGLFHLVPGTAPGAPWTITAIDRASSGFEHALLATDLDGDGVVELYVSSDDQAELRRYDYDPAGKAWSHRVLAPLEPRGTRLTWNITAGTL